MTESKTFVKMEHGDCESDPDAAVAQSVERHIGNVEVTGSIPVSSSQPTPKKLETIRFQASFLLFPSQKPQIPFKKKFWYNSGVRFGESHSGTLALWVQRIGTKVSRTNQVDSSVYAT